MKVKLDLELAEADVIFKALKVIDQFDVTLVQLKHKIQTASQLAVDAENATKEPDKQ